MPQINLRNRFGFHYFPDVFHYREHDLQAWLPKLESLRVGWLTLLAPSERAIPEYFITGLISSGIEPILHFHLPFNSRVHSIDLLTLFQSYSKWGVRYVALFDRPNLRSGWHPAVWTQSDLVERFLDLYLPIAEAGLRYGLTPVFPPLEPGGDYWDLAFFRGALNSMQKRVKPALLDTLAIGIYAWAGERPLDWGAGGLDRWPGARPYFTPPGVQDHLGFRIFDWYMDIAQQELGKIPQVLLLRAGIQEGGIAWKEENGTGGLAVLQKMLAIANLAVDESGAEIGIDPLPQQVYACNLWLLAVEDSDDSQSQAWFKPDGEPLPLVELIRKARASKLAEVTKGQKLEETFVSEAKNSSSIAADGKVNYSPIEHYVLMPLYGWGSGEWDFRLLEPLLQNGHPTIGFSLLEARLAKRVSVVGGEQVFSEAVLTMLRESGCYVERLQEDGTVNAT